MKLTNIFLTVIALAAPSAALYAQPENNPAKAADAPGDQNAASQNVNLYAELDALRSQNAILTERLKNADLKAKIRTAEGNQSGPVGTVTGKHSMPSEIPFQAQALMVSGVGSDLTADISLPSGVISVKAGRLIVGLGVVKSISRNEVLITTLAQQIISLPFPSATSSDGTTSSDTRTLPPPQGLPGGVR